MQMELLRLKRFGTYPNRLFIWGCGEAGITIYKACCIFGIKPEGFFDNSFPKGKTIGGGMDVFPLERLNGLDKGRTYFIITATREVEVSKELQKMGFRGIIYKNELGIQSRSEYPVLEFPRIERPELSVLITAYNEWTCTYNCLESLLANGNDTKFEVILGDDCSTDETARSELYLKNVTVVHHKKRMNYLGNVNEISKYAIGKYIMLLGNDVLFTAFRYIDALMERIKTDNRIGMIAGKTWVPWKVGYDYNTRFDEHGNPFLVKEEREINVDAVWPVASIVQRSLWKQLKGFDEIYLPVYYEDTDFCMRVIKEGYDVVSYPNTEVTHYGGGSYRWGGWLESLSKNRDIFMDRWESSFASEIRSAYWSKR